MNVEVRANFLDNGNIISIVSEITERKKIENELEEVLKKIIKGCLKTIRQ